MKRLIWTTCVMLCISLAACTPAGADQSGGENGGLGDSSSVAVDSTPSPSELSSQIPEQNFSWLGLDMGMDSASAYGQLHMLKSYGILGEKKAIGEPGVSYLAGHDYHLRGAGLDAKAIWKTHYYDGRLEMVELHFYEGVRDTDQLYDFLADIFGPTGIHKDGGHIWFKGNSVMRAQDPDEHGRHRIYWSGEFRRGNGR